jgi:hypothetical protein
MDSVEQGLISGIPVAARAAREKIVEEFEQENVSSQRTLLENRELMTPTLG